MSTDAVKVIDPSCRYNKEAKTGFRQTVDFEMKHDHVIPTKLAVLALVATAVCSNLHFLLPKVCFTSFELGNDEVTLYEQRLRKLKQELPSRGVVGYVFTQADWKRWDYTYTQYALAPLIVDKSLNHELIIGNFPDGVVPATVTTSPTLALIDVFGDGVMLFQNEVER